MELYASLKQCIICNSNFYIVAYINVGLFQLSACFAWLTNFMAIYTILQLTCLTLERTHFQNTGPEGVIFDLINYSISLDVVNIENVILSIYSQFDLTKYLNFPCLAFNRIS